jgi:hypothetical protein
MFGFVTANTKELSKEQLQRYCTVYCGICRNIRTAAGQIARLSLSYDMTFLALLLMSLYEPEESGGDNACMLHPIRKRAWVENDFVSYAAHMNIALAYYNCMDDWSDDHSASARLMAEYLRKSMPGIESRYPRQCAAIQQCIDTLAQLEAENCPNADAPANCFGDLMAELLVYQEDLWAPALRETGRALGRFIYLADAAADYRKDKRKKKYNPFLAMGMEEDWNTWDEYLVLSMGRCTHWFETLPLVQDKDILNNILYSGVWTNFHRKRKEAGQAYDKRSL